MSTATFAGQAVAVDADGFLNDPADWSREIAEAIASDVDIDLSDRHWQVIEFLRSDYLEQGETPTLRRVATVGGIPTKSLFQLFPKKPARKMSYVSGLQKPAGCI